MKTFILAAACLAASVISAAAQSPTREEQAACRSDAQKLCSQHIGKAQEMRACLVSNKDKLSAACKAVVENRGG
jgi:hypothetical protein